MALPLLKADEERGHEAGDPRGERESPDPAELRSRPARDRPDHQTETSQGVHQRQSGEAQALVAIVFDEQQAQVNRAIFGGVGLKGQQLQAFLPASRRAPYASGAGTHLAEHRHDACHRRAAARKPFAARERSPPRGLSPGGDARAHRLLRNTVARAASSIACALSAHRGPKGDLRCRMRCSPSTRIASCNDVGAAGVLLGATLPSRRRTRPTA